ncbi:uncharacterized protein LOC132742783 [Ruditapes philippinarum]|uniref:uncharacterized protein LOC132742783 n=1 Tax=Ruditapes philippinarum TaxID=129788 RepID=UPI00295AD73C|nr:uncharacterized protein LOC132742783 [Ruditapes philippinarum]
MENTIERMHQDPDYCRYISMKMSAVLHDIGINEESIQKRRSARLKSESMLNAITLLINDDASIYIFGSQSECSIPLLMQSDVDYLSCNNKINLVQTSGQWKPRKYNILVIQDDSTSPGYCLLQDLNETSDKDFETILFEKEMRKIFDSEGAFELRGERMLMKNTFLTKLDFKGCRNGPALTRPGNGRNLDFDYVKAMHCTDWPFEAKSWLNNQGKGNWPSKELKEKCETTGFFVVPVASKSGLYEDLEWRLSTSLAERLLMFSLNITQMRCYVLMKLIVKTFITPECGDVISSFICKTTLFFCIFKQETCIWREQNLLLCLKYCLEELKDFVMQENCPHFMIHGNNLLAGKVTSSNKKRIENILHEIIKSNGQQLLKISICDFGYLLQKICSKPYPFIQGDYHLRNKILFGTEVIIQYGVNTVLQFCMSSFNGKLLLTNFINSLVQKYVDIHSSKEYKKAIRLLTPIVRAFLGSIIASDDIRTNTKMSSTALVCLLGGFSSDAASGKLKLASALLSADELIATEAVLNNVIDMYRNNSVHEQCLCKRFSTELNTYFKPGFIKHLITKNEKNFRNVIALCVRYMPCEFYCMPKEIQYEIFRSSKKEKFRDFKRFDDFLIERFDDFLMAMGAVDSLPYLYFLQYKTYGSLRNVTEQQKALRNLINVIRREPFLYHRETDFNLLGQCMEQEERYEDAFVCYLKSFKIRSDNNVVRIHICKLLNRMINN